MCKPEKSFHPRTTAVGCRGSPVKSIRYRGPVFKTALTVFVIAFFILGYLGTQPPSFWGEKISQVCTVIYFGFFLAMPWYSKIDKYTIPPERVTG
ncbi:MAG: hypothetical protein ACKN9C_06785 [Fluviibacter sp.]